MSAPNARIESVDALRGLVMILMVLDHVRDYFHSATMSFQPEDPARTTAAIFLTRWVTHSCAPVFLFTAGLAATLREQRRTGNPSRHLVLRGLWLVLLEITVVRFAITFLVGGGLVILTVL